MRKHVLATIDRDTMRNWRVNETLILSLAELLHLAHKLRQITNKDRRIMSRNRQYMRVIRYSSRNVH
jgi:hypothetical protein